MRDCYAAEVGMLAGHDTADLDVFGQAIRKYKALLLWRYLLRVPVSRLNPAKEREGYPGDGGRAWIRSQNRTVALSTT